MTRFPLGPIHLGTLGVDPETDEKMLLFYGGPFSQWLGKPMKIDGVLYTGPEQYMMVQKARFFGDHVALKRILNTASPSRQKAFGRLVEPFDAERWDMFSRDVVRTATLHKFQQPGYRRDLLDSVGYTIVEASPTDDIWGIARGEDDPLAMQRSMWRGRNWLGQVLMEVRGILTL